MKRGNAYLVSAVNKKEDGIKASLPYSFTLGPRYTQINHGVEIIPVWVEWMLLLLRVRN